VRSGKHGLHRSKNQRSQAPKITDCNKTSAGLISNANELMALGERKDKLISKKE